MITTFIKFIFGRSNIDDLALYDFVSTLTEKLQ